MDHEKFGTGLSNEQEVSLLKSSIRDFLLKIKVNIDSNLENEKIILTPETRLLLSICVEDLKSLSKLLERDNNEHIKGMIKNLSLYNRGIINKDKSLVIQEIEADLGRLS